MNITGPVNRTINACKKEPLFLLGASVLALFLSSITFLILFPVMWAGLGSVFIKIDRGEKPDIKGLFTYIDKTLFLAVLGIIILAGWAAGLIVLIIPMFIIMALWVYAVFYLAYDDMAITGALSASASAALKNDFLAHIGAVIVLNLLNVFGAQLAGIGVLITFPLTCGFLVFMYDETRENL